MDIATRNLQVRIDDKLRKRAEKVFEKVGIDTPTAIRIFFSKVADTGSIPFPLQYLEDNYSPAMLKKLDRMAARAKKGIGISKGYTDVEEFLKDLHG